MWMLQKVHINKVELGYRKERERDGEGNRERERERVYERERDREEGQEQRAQNHSVLHVCTSIYTVLTCTCICTVYTSSQLP